MTIDSVRDIAKTFPSDVSIRILRERWTFCRSSFISVVLNSSQPLTNCKEIENRHFSGGKICILIINTLKYVATFK